ncbi:MAG TPA: hypothetical protein DCQ06_06535, partial [Myxococcales bacterium]|nr:hypothetical protein [Myxococcales bacterium]
MVHEEIELKLLLEDQWSYAQLRAWLDSFDSLVVAQQNNCYLDTPQRTLQMRRVMARLRLIDERAILTVKRRKSLQDGLMTAEEWQVELPLGHSARQLPNAGALVGSLPEEVAAPLRASGLDSQSRLHVFGAMQTNRRIYTLAPADWPGIDTDVCVELDWTLFDGQVERFELEIEHRLAGQMAPAIQAQLDTLAVAWRPA